MNIIYLGLIATLFVTNSAFALTFESTGSAYSDSLLFTQSEAVGIQLLTDIKAVEGNPDGTFAPRRTLNRAEFLKIVLLSHPAVEVNAAAAADCFPDVQADDWFSQYVCFAEANGIVDGYPDGTFKPGNAVNYAEALKILGELYQFTFASKPDEPWYQGYADAAITTGTALPEQPAYNTNLTRGQMARLAAAFYANSQGELQEYRQAEQGLNPISSASSSTSSEISSTSSSSSETSSSSNSSEESSESSSSSAAIKNEFSIQSHLLVANSSGTPIVGGIFTSETDVRAEILSVRFDREVRSVESLYITNAQGDTLGELELDLNDSQDRTWRGEFSSELLIAANTPTILYVNAQVKSTDDSVQAGELIVPREFRLISKTIDSNISVELIGGQPPFPSHIVTLGEITSITNSGASQGILTPGSSKQLANLVMQSVTSGKSPIQLKELTFTLEKSENVQLDRIRLGRGDTVESDSCSLNYNTLSCFIINQALQPINESTEFILYADVTLVGEASGSIQVILPSTGTVGENGSVRWSDGVNDYRFVDVDEPLFKGTKWLVE